jgi:hypothetical protein
LKTSSLSFSTAAAALLAAAIVVASSTAQGPHTPPAGQSSAGGAQGQRPREFPAPTDLKVLPKTLTGKQVRDIMESWSGQLGVHCSACHSADPNNVGPNGRPRMNFPDDSKPEKNTARLMFTMTQKINDDYVSMVNDGEAKVTCGTCHRGHMKPEDFVPPPEEEHGPPPAPGAPPQLPR